MSHIPVRKTRFSTEGKSCQRVLAAQHDLLVEGRQHQASGAHAEANEKAPTVTASSIFHKSSINYNR